MITVLELFLHHSSRRPGHHQGYGLAHQHSDASSQTYGLFTYRIVRAPPASETVDLRYAQIALATPDYCGQCEG